MPRVSATIRSRTRGSIPPTITDSSRSRASPSERPPDHQFGQPGQHLCAAVAGREDHRNRLGQQAPRDEGKCLHRHFVDPLRVIDDAEQGLIVGGCGHQAQHRQPDQETVRALHQRRGQRLRSVPRAVVPEVHQGDPAAARIAAAVRRRRAPCRTPRPPPGHSGTLKPTPRCTGAMRSCLRPPRRGAPAPGCYRIGQSLSDPEASRIRWSDRADAAPDPGST